LIGPPNVPPYWPRVKAGSSEIAKALRAWKDLWRRKPKMLPWYSFVPDLVMMLTTAPEARPNSGA
jgi:hypothetical protein